MEKIVDMVIQFLQTQVSSHGDEIWSALLFAAPAMVVLTVVTQIIKDPILKRWHDSAWAVRLAVLIQGVLYMFGHGVIFKGTFSVGEKVVIGIFLGCVNIALWHAWDWWRTRKDKKDAAS